MNKKELRQYYKALRHEIKGKAEKSDTILLKLKNTPEWRLARVIALYASLPDEVQTDAMIAAALNEGKRVCLPKTEKDNIKFFVLNNMTSFEPGAYGIREPKSDNTLSKEEIDLIIVPLLAADNNGVRLGFGGGYYDRYLKDFKGNSIGVCFKEQISPLPLPHETHDIPLDDIITD